MKNLYFLWLLFLPVFLIAQAADTLNGYQQKISGEEIPYFSPLHQFAPQALLTRMNGEMPISWESPVYTGKAPTVTYRFLLGHSTGTSKAERHFDCSLNHIFLFTITTPLKQKGFYELRGEGEKGSRWHFVQQEYDANADAFGTLYITLPASLVQSAARFTMTGKNENSRDWLMIFMYRPGLKAIVQPTALVTRKENKRQLNLFLDNPYPDDTPVEVSFAGGVYQGLLKFGYNKFSFPAWPAVFTGADTVKLKVGKKDVLSEGVRLSEVKPYTFAIIHHSHNDIGYSHLQTEVEQIQNNNIRAAIRWIESHAGDSIKPYWHIESLWAVENFLRTATTGEVKQFRSAVRSGQLVLSANYANVLTGLCQPEEMAWNTEFARMLAHDLNLQPVQMAMITDIPGITRSAFKSYADEGIRYLSLGPNYVEGFPDRGDRVGGVINEQGDQVFYWKENKKGKDSVLVWTAGKGYSYFHGIGESIKQESWEKKISDYANELTAKNYPFDLVQLRYTKNADNGPVDTLLTDFVKNWNERFVSPALEISSVPRLFAAFEKKYKEKIPVHSGEISPYWEDGAYSTAVEEMQMRQLALKTIALQKQQLGTARPLEDLVKFKTQIYPLIRNLVLFHEHTWGAWCSISDPESAFTRKQWEIKKSFLDSALYLYNQLAGFYKYKEEKKQNPDLKALYAIEDYAVDPQHGGLSAVIVNEENIIPVNGSSRLFEPVYMAGINPMQMRQTENVRGIRTTNKPLQKITAVTFSLPSLKNCTMTYVLDKAEKKIRCHYSFDKEAVTDKESLHIALPFALDKPVLRYGSPDDWQTWQQDQLPGSNREFICAEKEVRIRSGDLEVIISSPGFALYETGGLINEDQMNGAKVWKKKNDNPLPLYLYVLNNYWHTNYKASQEGHFEFDIEISFRKLTH